MLAFSRLTSILLFVLSLSFLTCAAPTAKSQGLALRGADVDANALLAVCVDAKVAIQAQLDACAHVTDVKTGAVVVTEVMAHIQSMTEVVVKVQAGATISDDIKVKIFAEVALLVKLVVKICAALVAKLGVSVAAVLCIQLDAAVKILLLTVEAHISGVIAACAKVLIDIKADVLVKLNLFLLAQALGLVKVYINTAVGVSL
ncbi:hypothetical protein BN14_10712 [Rhizoctonia solani AG-1 IB]|uniref:Transmembrane protein n=1 Tax=Thanatephorus cucumeris (strain AG1-IB / isolate 7/3/14) TaxID=1108050 RepID=M5CGR4_THACB|nr:hypothetical protein BN14_10712 [Rhizoctonia solani AG-1 IB]